MVQIIPEMKKQRFVDRLMSGAENASRTASTEIPKFFGERILQQRKREAFRNLGLPEEINDLPEELQKTFVEKTLGNKASKPDYSNASRALDNLEQLVSKPGIGLLGKVNPGSKARFNRGEFEASQAAILPIFKSMFPRGMTEKEFKFIQEHYIPQAGDTEAKIKGKIQGLRRIVEQQSLGFEGSLIPEMREQQERPPLSSFHR